METKKSITRDQVKKWIQDKRKIILLDVRSAEEFELGQIYG
jgi:rhodanese-related sulfurtransferase